MINFIFGIHNHQPLGNFGWVFESAYERSYRPFMEVLEDYPNMKVAVHISGPLFEWISSNRPEYLDLLRSLIKKGQLEMVVAGFYEPVLAAIPDEDAVEQIELLKNFVKDLGYKAKGLWLTERVWQPKLVRILGKAGIEYVIVDDYHFMSAGLDRDQLHWPYYTEENGETVIVFPIDEKLRYLIPFRPVEKTLEYLHGLDSGDESRVKVFHDDGEKFGVWPGTYEWVYEKGWLRDFFDSISSDDRINVTLYSEYLSSFRPRGVVYLPIASYFEMSEWSLPAKSAREFVDFVEWLRSEGRFERYRVFVRGGIWKNFFFKYPESNYMHKRMLMVGRLIGGNVSARGLILRAQCNDAYWHGVFGGIYLPHLRREVWSNIIRANSFVKTGNFVKDFDLDGMDEVFLESDGFYAVFRPSYGGSLVEFSSKGRAVNYVDVLTRRWEHYHSLHESVENNSEDGEGVASIHELARSIPEDIKREVAYDRTLRHMLQDHFIPIGTTIEDYRLAAFTEAGDFVTSPYEFRLEEDSLIMRRSGLVNGKSASVTKVFRFDECGFRVDYSVDGPSDFIFGTELNLAVHSVQEDPGELRASRLTINDKYGMGKVSIEIEGNGDFKVWKFPVRTLSQSESGWDFIQQGVSYTFLAPVDGALRFTLRFREVQ